MKRGRRKTSAAQRQRDAVFALDCAEGELAYGAREFGKSESDANRRSLKSYARKYAAAVRRVINSGRNP